ncbi:hypothetical protein BP6252_12393 [Coleophoma cylindrospora]|uniref:Yippee domain-containing protein n=1 Tax=Coleophoma cylindrospora TaxID=1849047 RepID=A0A3D8QH63_9HELO|nr:hypothetical protein BP6252_12393 [Coleophoma cylindrospora]
MSSEPPNRPPFPSYLLPSISFPIFRRRQTSTSSISTDSTPPSLGTSTTTTPSSSPPNPSKSLVHQFNNIKNILQNHADSSSKAEQPSRRIARIQAPALKCVTCGTDLAFASQIVSKGFTGRHGRAYLVAPPEEPSGLESDILLNTKVGRSVNRQLLTGAHVVADVTCSICHTVLGWKYVDAKETAQKYKIGKFILETKRVVASTSWEDDLPGDDYDESTPTKEGQENDNVVLFDSEDEDECEDLFGGTWDPEIVARRRGSRVPVRRHVDSD